MNVCEWKNCGFKGYVNTIVSHEIMRDGEVEGEIEKHFHRVCAEEYLRQCGNQRKELQNEI